VRGKNAEKGQKWFIEGPDGPRHIAHPVYGIEIQ
jgi:hypothetical protein